MRSFVTVLTIMAFAVASIHAQGNEIPTETGRAIEQGADRAEIERIPEGSRVNVTLSNGRRAIFDEAKIQRAVATHIAARDRPDPLTDTRAMPPIDVLPGLDAILLPSERSLAPALALHWASEEST